MLQELLPESRLAELLTVRRQTNFFPPAAQRHAWQRLAEDDLTNVWRQEIIHAAAELVTRPWPELTATALMEYIRSGSRSAYEIPYFERRRRLGILVLAECCEYQGHYLDPIINAIWSILSEPDWCIPAHALYQADDPLPCPYTGRVDLFAAITGMQLAETLQLLEPELKARSASLVTMIREELLKRIVVPVENYPDGHWWLNGYNNWTPWCSSNVAGCALTLQLEPQRQARLLTKLLAANDRFIGNYRPDGGCEEGPGYWCVAAGMLLFFLDIIDHATDGALMPVFQTPLFRNMAEYIAKVHLCGYWFLSPSDAGANCRILNPCQPYRLAELTGSTIMNHLGAAATRCFEPQADTYFPITQATECGNLLTFALRNLFQTPPGTTYQPVEHEAFTLLPDLQIGIFRQNPEVPEKGLILALKGGHNAESHNHNDIGQFEVFSDGQPLIVDIGAATYVRQSFSEQRYDLWNTGAQGHNIPAINGVLQQAGGEYRAVMTEATPTAMTLDLSAAYPSAAGLGSFTRTATFDALGGKATITDRISAQTAGLKIEIPLFSPFKPEMTAANQLRWNLGEYAVTLSAANLNMVVEPMPITDQRLRRSWPETIYKIILTGYFAAANAEWELRFTRA